MHNSIIQISNESKSCLGTGFVIDKDIDGVFVATCGHVVNNCGETILVEGKRSEIIVNSYDDGLDLAVLYVKDLNIEPLPITDSKLDKTAKVIGFSKLGSDSKKEPINNIRIKTDIEFTKSSFRKIEAIKLYPDEDISNGYSGSPVIGQDSNKIIGIVNIQVGKNTNYAISTKHLLEIYKINDATSTIITSTSTSRTKTDFVKKLGKEDCMTLTKQFEKNLAESLQTFSTQQNVWIEPRLHTKEEDLDISTDKDTKVEVADIVTLPKSSVIQARQQFGLTCLAHYLVKEAWINEKPSFWLYLDANKLKPHTMEIKKSITKILKPIGLSIEDIECVVLDEFSSSIKNANKILNALSDFLDDIHIIVMMTIIENPLLNESTELPENRKFDLLHLWALPRGDVRKMVSECNNEKYIGDENAVVSKIISDLEVLNIPRTALNCLTILKIYEVEFDDSPVNRTEMIRRVLFLLFNIDEIPHYKNRPDLKDTEYVLGFFCELMLKSSNYYFTREGFLETLNNFCESSEVDLEVHVIFDVLYANNIVVMRGQYFCFKFSYWVFYFAAHRMHHNPDFTNFIFQEMNYTSYPELIEFYAGIDRRRDDALKILIRDIRDVCNIVEDKCGLPSDFNIYNMAQWQLSETGIQQMHNEVASGVLGSNLPDSVKDQYADQSYDRTRPLTQNIYTILEKYSLLRLMRSIQAGARALRNSDYCNPVVRHELLQEILRSWDQIVKVLIVISPVLSKKGYATLEGASFALYGDFGESPKKRFNEIIQALPCAVVDWYKDDLFSTKMGPLLYKHMDSEKNEFIRHALNLLIIKKRPKGWYSHIEKCILAENKNSFYLWDMYTTLRTEYSYSFSSNSTLSMLGKLIKITAAKHDLGVKKPGSKIIEKISDNILPERDDRFI